MTIEKHIKNKYCVYIIFTLVILIAPLDAFASGALSGGGGSGLPFEQGISAIWTSVSEFLAPIAVALGVIIGIILFARGSAGSAIYALFGFALIGGVALGITEIFNVFGWDGAVIEAAPVTKTDLSSQKESPQ